MSKNLYGSDDSLITGGIIYDETEETTQDLINAEQKKAGVYYCTCSTAASTQKKTVTISGITALYDGLKIRVRFTNEQSYNGVPTLDLNSLGAWPINRDSTGMAGQYEWTGGEVLDLVYDSTLQRWVIVGGERASEGHYGKTKLFTSVLSPSTNMAATPASVKQVNDKVGDGVLDSGFTATDLTEAANELKNTLTQLDGRVDYTQNDIATILQDPAQSTFTAGSYVIYNNQLYTVNAGGIPQDTPASSYYPAMLTAVSAGGLNDLKNRLNVGKYKIKKNITDFITFSSGVTPVADTYTYGVMISDYLAILVVECDCNFAAGSNLVGAPKSVDFIETCCVGGRGSGSGGSFPVNLFISRTDNNLRLYCPQATTHFTCAGIVNVGGTFVI